MYISKEGGFFVSARLESVGSRVERRRWRFKGRDLFFGKDEFRLEWFGGGRSRLGEL